MLLVHYLRDVLGLTGTHVGCETSICGACTILLDGQAVKSCTMFAVQADGIEHHDDRRACGERQSASGAGRFLGMPRLAMRLLHAGNDHDFDADHRSQSASHRAKRFDTGSKEICVAAPAISTSSKRLNTRPRKRGARR